MANRGICSITGCDNPLRKRQWCEIHYKRWRRYGDPQTVHRAVNIGRTCAVDWCEKSAKRRGWCNAHYMRWQKHGDPLAGPTHNGQPEIFLKQALSYDGEDCLFWPFSRSKRGYATMRLKDRPHVTVSRIVCEEMNGQPPSDDHQAAHLCGNGHLGCITKKHLAWKTPKENSADRDIHGTTARGEKNGGCKLSANDVTQIRASKGKRTQRDLAKEFGVTHNTIGSIQRMESWKSLQSSRA